MVVLEILQGDRDGESKERKRREGEGECCCWMTRHVFLDPVNKHTSGQTALPVTWLFEIVEENGARSSVCEVFMLHKATLRRKYSCSTLLKATWHLQYRTYCANFMTTGINIYKGLFQHSPFVKETDISILSWSLDVRLTYQERKRDRFLLT